MSPEHSPHSEEPVFKRSEADFSPWSEATNEHRETMPQREIAFSLIKPGFEDHYGEIVDILKDNGLEVIYTDKITLSPQAVDYMYGESRDQHFYEAMKSHLTSREVTMLMVGGPGHEAQEIMSGLKKTKDGKDGLIRALLQKDEWIGPEEIEQWQRGEHPNQDEVTVRLTQRNVIHTADTTEEAVESLRLLLGDKFNELRVRGALPSELWDYFKDSPSPEEDQASS
jgi:nucleoside diphosphate kinase